MTVATRVRFLSRRFFEETNGAQRHQSISVDGFAILIDHDQSVGVAIKRDADVCFSLLYLSRTRLGVKGADASVDVLAIRRDTDGKHFGAELREHEGRGAVGGAMGRIDDDAHSLERAVPPETCFSHRRRSGPVRRQVAPRAPHAAWWAGSCPAYPRR